MNGDIFLSLWEEPGSTIQALLYDIDFTENDSDTAIRQGTGEIGPDPGAGCLHQMLQEIDPVSRQLLFIRIM